MDKKRGMFVVGGGFALLVAGYALFRWNRERIASELAEQARTEDMIREYEEYSNPTPVKKRPPRQRKQSANGRAARQS